MASASKGAASLSWSRARSHVAAAIGAAARADAAPVRRGHALGWFLPPGAVARLGRFPVLATAMLNAAGHQAVRCTSAGGRWAAGMQGVVVKKDAIALRRSAQPEASVATVDQRCLSVEQSQRFHACVSRRRGSVRPHLGRPRRRSSQPTRSTTDGCCVPQRVRSAGGERDATSDLLARSSSNATRRHRAPPHHLDEFCLHLLVDGRCPRTPRGTRCTTNELRTPGPPVPCGPLAQRRSHVPFSSQPRPTRHVVPTTSGLSRRFSPGRCDRCSI